jgi:hypothetical protein
MTRKTKPSKSSKPNAVRVLLLREGRPADVVNVETTTETFAAVVGGEPLLMSINSQFSLVLAKSVPKGARNNVRVVDVGGEANGLVAGDVFVVQHDERGGLMSMDEGSLAAMRGFFEGRRVGTC